MGEIQVRNKLAWHGHNTDYCRHSAWEQRPSLKKFVYCNHFSHGEGNWCVVQCCWQTLNCREDGRRKASKLYDDVGMTNGSPWRFFVCLVVCVLLLGALLLLFCFVFPENKCCGKENYDGGSLTSQNKSIKKKKGRMWPTKNCDYIQDASTLAF